MAALSSVSAHVAPVDDSADLEYFAYTVYDKSCLGR